MNETTLLYQGKKRMYETEFAKFTGDHEIGIVKKDSSIRNSTKMEDYMEILNHELISPGKVHVAIGERKNSTTKAVTLYHPPPNVVFAPDSTYALSSTVGIRSVHSPFTNPHIADSFPPPPQIVGVSLQRLANSSFEESQLDDLPLTLVP